MDRPNGIGILLKGTAMKIIVGPVLTRKDGYAFDRWRETPETRPDSRIAATSDALPPLYCNQN
jgi:hypothetical protein